MVFESEQCVGVVWAVFDPEDLHATVCMELTGSYSRSDSDNDADMNPGGDLENIQIDTIEI